jgi:hypothetical protein
MFAQLARQRESHVSRLSYVGLLDSERRNLHARIDIDNTLDFRVNSWYRDASTGDTVPVALPAAREASADVCDMPKEAKILLCGHSVRATTIDLLQRLEERTNALLRWLSTLQTCAGVADAAQLKQLDTNVSCVRDSNRFHRQNGRRECLEERRACHPCTRAVFRLQLYSE